MGNARLLTKVAENYKITRRLVTDVGSLTEVRRGSAKILQFLMLEARQVLFLQSRVQKTRCSADLPS